MSALETAAGAPRGEARGVRFPSVARDPLEVLEEIVAESLARPPCYVAFSGGRDSSLVLAAAVRSATSRALPAPIALTMQFPASGEAGESKWQELVLDHLGVESRVCVDVSDELDLVGPVAAAELERRGLLFPANSHSLAPLVERADGGSLLVGLGGDELLGGHRWTALNDALARRRRPVARDALRLAVAALPAVVRRRALAHRASFQPPEWLTPAAAEQLRTLESHDAAEPVRFDRALRWAARQRITSVAAQSSAVLGKGSEVDVTAPLLDPRFVGGLARAGGARGFGGRAATMRAVAGGALPDELLARADKARFNATFFGDATRRFARAWSGRGVDTSLVDPDALRRAWLEDDPDFRSALLLQVAWLHDRGQERTRPGHALRLRNGPTGGVHVAGSGRAEPLHLGGNP